MIPLVFIIVLSLLIFVHELGHFVIAKLSGIKVEEFAFGFPPRLVSIKKGETNYSINLIPIGGYVKMLGEDGKSKDPRAFGSKSVGSRLLVVIAGVSMNIILAVILIAIGFNIGMSPLQSKPSDLGGQSKTSILITAVLKNSPAQKANLTEGDKVLALIDENKTTKINSVADLQQITKKDGGQSVELNIIRKGQNLTVPVELGSGETPLGVGLVEDTVVKLPFWQAIKAGFIETGKSIVAIVMFIVSLIAGLFHGNAKLGEAVGGPVAVYSFTSEAVKLGLTYVIQLTALLSINLAILNILPIPALDGGRGLFIILEGIFGKKLVNENTEGVIHTIGFIILVILLLAISVRDVIRLY
jgi:regulator of sigma E protease